MPTRRGDDAAILHGAAAVLLGCVREQPRAEAQEIQLTGPLAGAPAVRKLRLYREGRFEIARRSSFTLLDEYQRTILSAAASSTTSPTGSRSACGARSAREDADGTHRSHRRSDQRSDPGPPGAPPSMACPDCEGEPNDYPTNISTNNLLTRANLGARSRTSWAAIDWVVAPQVTLVPFRGKLALFQKIFVDTDLYFFGGPAFVGLNERADCGPPDSDCAGLFGTTTRTAIAPTFGLGLSFYMATS